MTEPEVVITAAGQTQARPILHHCRVATREKPRGYQLVSNQEDTWKQE